MISNIPEATFRCFQGEADYSLILSILMKSAKLIELLKQRRLKILSVGVPSHRFDPNNDISFAALDNEGEEPSVIGFSRVSWYTGMKDTRLYSQTSYLLLEWRDLGIWPVMIRRNKRRLQDIASSHPSVHQRFFQAWATEAQVKWISVLEGEGYQAVRHFHNMLHRLDAIPDQEIPEGLEARPVQEEHYRSIWEAQKEVNQELFEYVGENWTEEKYQS